MEKLKHILAKDLFRVFKSYELDIWALIKNGKITPKYFDTRKGGLRKFDIEKLRLEHIQNGTYSETDSTLGHTRTFKIIIEKSELQNIGDDNPYLKSAVKKLKKESVEKPPGSSIDAKEKIELGQLRIEKQNWDTSIEAAVMATIYSLKQKDKIIKKELEDELKKYDLPETTFLKIWKAIPEQYRSSGGRPSKK